MDAVELPPFCPPPANDVVPLLVVVGLFLVAAWVKRRFFPKR
jgi:flagellar biogenesis protein FliO